MDDGDSKTFEEMSIETTLLIQCFEALGEGKVVSYEDMEKLIGRDVRTAARGALRTARKRVLCDSGIHIACIPKVGMKRLAPGEALGDGDRKLASSRRAARRADTSYSQVDATRLSDEEKLRLAAGRTRALVIADVASERARKKIESALTGTEAKPLPIGKALDLFK